MQACQNGHFLRDWPAMKNLADHLIKITGFLCSFLRKKRQVIAQQIVLYLLIEFIAVLNKIFKWELKIRL
jgi:hypothetical protein